jgi:uncharacterized Fe-S center protein
MTNKTPVSAQEIDEIVEQLQTAAKGKAFELNSNQLLTGKKIQKSAHTETIEWRAVTIIQDLQLKIQQLENETLLQKLLKLFWK